MIDLRHTSALLNVGRLYYTWPTSRRSLTMDKKNIKYLALTTSDELRRYKEQWDSLELRSTQCSAMLSYAWISNHFEYFLQQKQSWICLVANVDDQLVAVLPLVLEKQLLPAPHLIAKSPYGAHLNITDILCEEGAESVVVTGLLNFAFTRLPKLAYVACARVPALSPMLNIQLSTESPLKISSTARSSGYFLPVPDDYQEFEQSLSRNFRSNFKKATNKLARLGTIEFESLDARVDSEQSLKRFCDIERSGWKGRMGTAIGESDHLANFYTAVSRDLKEADILEWHFLKSSEHDLAGHMAFRIRDKLVLWKLAYNEEFSACSPGGQLMREIIKREIDAGNCSEIDLTTDQDWYSNWKLVKRPYYQVRIYNRRFFISIMYLYLGRLRTAASQVSIFRLIRDKLRNINKLTSNN
jgi:CelD/BcsL family acetyltransferase involved in cellulose biosynthesis